MPQILLECKNCNRIFPSGISMGAGSQMTFIGTKSQCPNCGSMKNIPDGTFKATVEGFIQILQKSQDPLKEAQELLKNLQESKSRADLETIKQSSKFSAWIPNTPERIAAYIAIIYTVVQLLAHKPDAKIEYNTFIKEYNQNTNITLVQNQDENSDTSKKQGGR